MSAGDFDAADYLTDHDTVVSFLSEIFACGPDTELLLSSVDSIIRSKGYLTRKTRVVVSSEELTIRSALKVCEYLGFGPEARLVFVE